MRHAAGELRAGAVVVCAGAWSDRLARASGAPAEPRIVPFRGAYLRLREERAQLVRANIYPVPDPELPFLGAHLTRGPDGSVLLGPTALIAGGPRRLPAHPRASGRRPRDRSPGRGRGGSRAASGAPARSSSRTRRRAARLGRRRPPARSRAAQPRLRARSAGVRAQAVARDGTLLDDFLVSRSGRCVHVRNAPSPAATSSLPLARLIADEVEPLLA